MKIAKHSVAKKIILVCNILFCLSFVANAVNIVFFYRNLYLSELDEIVALQLEELTDELRSYKALDYWLVTWRTDPSSVVLPKDKHDKTLGEWYANYGDLYESSATREILEEDAEYVRTDGPEFFTALSSAIYVQLEDEFEQFFRYSQTMSLTCFYPVENGEAFVFFTSSNNPDSEHYSFELGNSYPFNMDLHYQLKESIDGDETAMVREILTSSVDGRRFIQYHIPMYNKNGDLSCVVSTTVWWNDVIRNIVKGAVRVELINALFHLVILAILIYLLNVTVGRPLLKIKDSVVTYSDDKDTQHFVDSLAPLRSLKDEFSILSGEIGSMAVNIRRYMDENLALVEEKKHLEGQLFMAVELKHQLMPNVFPAFPDEDRLEIYADQIAFEKIGGDYYDFFAIDRDHIAVVIADIFDGGTPSALFMVAFKIILSQIASYGLPPSKIMEIVNNRLSRYNADDLTLSAWFGIYEISTGQVTAVNAGHECPLIISEDGVREVEEDIRGFVVGMTEGMPYPDYSFALKPGNHLVLYTDGILCAENASGEAFGYDRMVKAIADAASSCRQASEQDMNDSLKNEIGAVQNAVFDFVGNVKLDVDITMMILGRNDV